MVNLTMALLIGLFCCFNNFEGREVAGKLCWAAFTFNLILGIVDLKSRALNYKGGKND